MTPAVARTIFPRTSLLIFGDRFSYFYTDLFRFLKHTVGRTDFRLSGV